MTTTTALEPVLTMSGVVKQFPGVLACNKAELSVRAGEVHCLLGANGAGKSTMMKILGGAYMMDAGEVRLGGEVLHLNGPAAGLAAGISVIYQELDLVGDLTVAENLYLGRSPARLGWVDRATRREQAVAMLKRVGARFSPDIKVGSLPVAGQQLTAIAKALTMDARVLVMDEPSAALNENELQKVFAVIRDLTAQGLAIIYISHRFEEVRAIGDRATVMRDGRTIGTYDIASVTERELVTAMIGEHNELVERVRREPAAGEPLLKAKRVHIEGVLDIRDLNVRRGEVIGLAGLDGSGRTTFLSAIFGATRAETDIEYDGKRVRFGDPGTAVRAGIGLVPEDRKTQGLMTEMSVTRNTTVASLRRKVTFSPGSLGALAEPALKRLGVRYASGDLPVGRLSGGNQQKVVLAKWLTSGVNLLLLDEPTRGLDIGAKAELYQEVLELADSGVAVIVASSELSELMAYTDSVWVFHEGRNIASFDPAVASRDEIAYAVVTGNEEAR
ncbi:sugar ABC transporter ATP-binding protein [Kineosporia succinea]|uniref:Ribose transport system ATP-binding protein n=1 Tax=Kineosporia succinea TaxID=84632 RepID=A0ABT9PCR2_9ACTN|nr:sugar ABC transporter ATP-binding protein [Kineosporia succinea]MDP9830478.1 ribose transport system ATP-binding protein [Kineosporia succinea]